MSAHNHINNIDRTMYKNENGNNENGNNENPNTTYSYLG